MAYIVVTKERPPEGSAQLCERVGSADFEAGHFRNCLSDRLAWAVEDAEREPSSPPVEEEQRRVPEQVLANV